MCLDTHPTPHLLPWLQLGGPGGHGWAGRLVGEGQGVGQVSMAVTSPGKAENRRPLCPRAPSAACSPSSLFCPILTPLLHALLPRGYPVCAVPVPLPLPREPCFFLFLLGVLCKMGLHSQAPLDSRTPELQSCVWYSVVTGLEQAAMLPSYANLAPHQKALRMVFFECWVQRQTILLRASRLAWPLRRLYISSPTPIPAPFQLGGGFTWLWRLPQSRLCVFLLLPPERKSKTGFSLLTQNS